MEMVSEKEIEAAREAWREYWSDVTSQYDDNKSPMEGMRRALEAAARVRAEADESGEVVASILLGKDNVIDGGGANISQPLHNKHITIRDCEVHPAPQPSVKVKPLEWVASDGWEYRWTADLYAIEDQGKNWSTDRYWLYYNGQRLGKFGTFD